jgi:hypothetical protein
MCLYPKLIKNRKYLANKKNGGNVPPINDKRVLYVPVGCGKCMECKKQKARNWSVRLQEEIRHNKKQCYFVTLTYNEKELQKLENETELKGYDRDNEVTRISIRRFLERWRKKYKKSVKHWFVTEIGGNYTERIHVHGLIWTDKKEEIENIWKYGKIWIGEYVNSKTINYIVKYINKVDNKHKYYNSKIYTSAGIGKGYTERTDIKNNKYKPNETNEYYTTRQGIKLPLPIYYRNKIYTEEEREKLWIEKLDKEKRYVNGVEVDISKGDEKYYKLLKIAQLKNERLGYGNNKINWDLKRYENERRNLKKLERVKKLNDKNKNS